MKMLPIKNQILTAAEMARVDEYAIRTLGIPGCVLMERAGKAVADVCRRALEPLHAPKVVVVCGPGNNGGDGYVVARHLAERGAQCRVFLLGAPEKVKGDAKLNFEIWRKLGQTVEPFENSALAAIAQADLIVDAMLGTGAKGALRGPFRQAAQAINQSRALVVAVDLPTGIDADTGSADPDAVRATHTVTFGAVKIGLLFSPARECAGQVSVADIGFPALAFEKIATQIFVMDTSFAATLLPRRSPTAFKNRCGQVLVVAGSTGMDGAAALCSKAVLKAGAGLALLATPAEIARFFGDGLYEVMKLPLAAENGKIAADAWPGIEAQLKWADVVAAGPGLGQGEGPRTIIHNLVAYFEGTLVLDADGLNALVGQTEILKKRKGQTILTPHPGEFSRLNGLPVEKILANPLQVARDFAQQYNVHLLLKGATSVAALPDGRAFVNGAGNPGMATAGVGDVLTGVVAGLAGQVDAEHAALLGMFAHSLAGDLAARQFGEISITAGTVLDLLPAAFQKTQQAATAKE